MNQEGERRVTGELGDPPRFTLERIVRPTFKVRWEYDGYRHDYDLCADEATVEPCRKVKVETFFSERAAYAWLARRMIFARRDKFEILDASGGKSCALCEQAPRRYAEDPPQCRYHDTEPFQRLTERLARWLRWRDRRRAELWCPECRGRGESPGHDDHWILCSACKGSGRRAELGR